MEIVIEKFGQTLLALVASVQVIELFLWVLDKVSAF